MFDYHMHSTLSHDGHNTPLEMAQAALDAGLTLRFSGNPDLNRPIRVQLQDIPPDTQVEPGRTVTITFTDPEAAD